ncbi:peptidylprolyl isomerase [Cyclobacterium amurskyense]|uniref:Survival protein SurA (Peptidyl-prolyl cis-trans isomerase SurA) n=1 Tax=Cyclobacterium amurskyense TaxID=320787 RepID=A0A0H4PB15_9BACT|nr:peptidylprolyl isomerase [Cyclobacterium amurskyense]AKP51626.1 Survival protein SurA (Peptidyl-prolyl cis-trans isomerase SurA) [Cyclobacterium amurskyense]
MNLKHIYFLLLGILFASATPVPDPIKEANPPLDYLLKIDGETSDREEFLYILNKNRQKDAAPISRTEFEENFELFVDYKLKVKYAMDLGMHKTKAFSDEFSAFKDQLKKPYLLENSLTEGELRKAYSRMQEIVKASHILFQFPQNASKEDSIAVFKMAEKIKAEAEAGEDFHQLAVQHSDDPSASSNKGSLGYFTALQMVLPFEEAAYNLKVGEISSPIISDFGYHIIKLEDRRPNPGQLHVSHLLIRSAGAEEDQMAFNKINQIHQNLIENPSQWLELVKTYSEDPGSKANKGMIPWFGVGSIVPEFEHAAFSLSKKGDFSAPVKTEYGYHIIRLEGAKPVPPFNEVLPTIKSNILRDSRSNLIKDQVLAMQKAKFNVTENSQLINSLKNAFSSSSGRPVAQLYIKLEGLSNKGDKLIVRSEWKDATIQDFIAYLKKEGPSVNTLLNVSFDEVYGDYLENLLATWEEEHLYQNNKDYRQLVNEYKNGMLLFELMNNEVWQKALEDSTGQRNYFQNNTDNYMWSKRVKALIVKAIKSQNISKVESWLSTKTLTDSLSTELKNRFLEKNTLLFTVEQKTFEVDNNELLSELDLNQTFHKLHQNEETVLIVLGETLPARQKKYEETRGRLIQDYQQYLETKLITELKQKYTIQVNEDEKEKIYQSLAK